MLSDTANLAPCPTAGCCHQVNLMPLSQSHCTSVFKHLWQLLKPFQLSDAFALHVHLSIRLSRLSIRLSRLYIASKRVNTFSNFLHHLVAPPFSFYLTKRYANIRMEVKKNCNFWPIPVPHFITMQFCGYGRFSQIRQKYLTALTCKLCISF